MLRAGLATRLKEEPLALKGLLRRLRDLLLARRRRALSPAEAAELSSIFQSRYHDLSNLAVLSQLRWLSANGLDVQDDASDLQDGVAPLAGMDALERLYLNDNQIVDVAPLAELPNLKWLEIRNNQVESLDALLGQTIVDNQTGDTDFAPGIYGMVLSEAVARGLAIVSTTAGAAEETLPAGTALLVEDGDWRTLMWGLGRAIDDPKIRQRLADASWAAASSLPRWEETARRLADAIVEFGQ